MSLRIPRFSSLHPIYPSCTHITVINQQCYTNIPCPVEKQLAEQQRQQQQQCTKQFKHQRYGNYEDQSASTSSRTLDRGMYEAINDGAPSSLIESCCSSCVTLHRERLHPNTSPGRCVTVALLSCFLQQLCDVGPRSLPSSPSDLTVFHTSCIPSISIIDYFHRLCKYVECSQESAVQAVYHIVKVQQQSIQQAEQQGKGTKPRFIIDAFNIHRLLLTALLVTSKLQDGKDMTLWSFGRC